MTRAEYLEKIPHEHLATMAAALWDAVILLLNAHGDNPQTSVEDAEAFALALLTKIGTANIESRTGASLAGEQNHASILNRGNQ